MNHKNVELVEAKAEGQGIITAIASAFDNIDRQGEKVLAGSFNPPNFGFLVPPGGKRRRNGYTEISEVELLEVGPTLIGANPEARTLAVKAFEEAGEDERSLLDMGEDELRAEIDRLTGAGKALKAKTFDPRPVQVTTFKC